MKRTSGRPLARNRLTVRQAQIFALLLAAAGQGILFAFNGWLSAVLTLMATIGYAFYYTLILKPSTSQNIVIGGLAGAAPPLLGWTAITNSADPLPLLLVGLIYVWTPAHFWALALDREEEYRNVGYPMLPVTHGAAFTRLQVLLYAMLTLMLSMIIYLVGGFGFVYLLVAVALGGWYTAGAWMLMRSQTREAARTVFTISLWYIMGIFAAMLLDRYL